MVVFFANVVLSIFSTESKKYLKKGDLVGIASMNNNYICLDLLSPYN